MQQETSLAQQMEALDKTVLTYYDYSFRVDNERCMVVMQKLISQVEHVLLYLSHEQQKCLQNILMNALSAMDNKDYVLLRDLMYYDLRNFLGRH